MQEPSPPPPPPPSSLFTTLQTQGYVLIRNLLSADELIPLRAAAAETTHLARTGQWPHIRTVPKQFPPWPSTPPPITTLPDGRRTGGIWGVQHLLHPALRTSPVFASLYFSRTVLAAVRAVLTDPDASTSTSSSSSTSPPPSQQEPQQTEPQLVLELCNLLVAPAGPFALRWHRDDISADASAAAEAAALGGAGRAAGHAQYNIALVGDASLQVVPGSHRRARTEAERAAAAGAPKEMPGAVVVRLAAGDAVFYDSNILHRGVYAAAEEGGKEEEGRMTVHASVGDARAGMGRRARVVLQHGVAEWVGGCEFGGGLLDEETRRVAEEMRERLVELGRSVEGDVGFAHAD